MLTKVSQRALRKGCKYCGYGQSGNPEPMYWFRDDGTNRFVLCNASGKPHDCPKRTGRIHADPGESVSLAGTASEGAAFETEPEAATEPEAEPVSPMDAIKAAMEAAMQAELAKMFPGQAGTATAVTGSPKGTPGITSKTGIWQLLAATADKLPRVILYGPPGTGKTHLAMTAGIADPADVDRVNMTEDTPAAEIRGHYVPKGGGEFVWHDGPGMRRFRDGGRLVIDEITRATDDALSFLLALLDGHRVTLPSGEVVERHPQFSCWATTNDGPEALTDALADRFTVRIECNEVNPEALATLPDHLSRIVTCGDDGGVTFREAAEYHRLTSDTAFQAIAAACKRDLAAEYVFGKRAKDVAKAIEMGTKLT